MLSRQNSIAFSDAVRLRLIPLTSPYERVFTRNHPSLINSTYIILESLSVIMGMKKESLFPQEQDILQSELLDKLVQLQDLLEGLLHHLYDLRQEKKP